MDESGEEAMEGEATASAAGLRGWDMEGEHDLRGTRGLFVKQKKLVE